jgi:hypothetical protein
MKISAALAILALVAYAAFTLRPGLWSVERWFAPKAELWAKWQIHDPTSKAKVDHSEWNGFLGKYVARNEKGVALVDYSKVTAADLALLDSYILRLSKTPIAKHNKKAQLAYWINLYNALTVRLVLSHFPVASIRDIRISPGLLSFGPWDKILMTIDGEMLTLNDIEHRILRPIWRDPRIHYVVNCASIGCPNLGSIAYSADAIEEQLDTAAREYINSEHGVSLVDGKISVSKIYNWFMDDFGGSEQAVMKHLAVYAGPELKDWLSSIGRIRAQHYDWSLNGLVR